MAGGAKKFRLQHHFGRSWKKGRGRKPYGVASVSREQAPTLFDNSIITEDGSSCVRGVDASRTCTEDVINGGVCEMTSLDSGCLVDYDRADAIGHSEVCVSTSLPDSAHNVYSSIVRVDADPIDASELHDTRTHKTTTTLEGLSSVSATALFGAVERFSESSGAAARQDASKTGLRIHRKASNP
ncbi:hypothetical protein HPB51_002080 [Rhipicephalus microplus]|uniref:Uncharacterized protein n=1 Tax=Rhipicephalus microplus TaxID=6941 RepID=A0A9J6E501_RHIMP|nr:hypothetical protein HPB51_002080 [Rhipicephalus microplus]